MRLFFKQFPGVFIFSQILINLVPHSKPYSICIIKMKHNGSQAGKSRKTAIPPEFGP
jgi:hypothetical protein